MVILFGNKFSEEEIEQIKNNLGFLIKTKDCSLDLGRKNKLNLHLYM